MGFASLCRSYFLLQKALQLQKCKKRSKSLDGGKVMGLAALIPSTCRGLIEAEYLVFLTIV
jgi:hypothetical protein